MSDNSRSFSVPPFAPAYRASGLLLHVTSLPSPYGIGDVGPAALAWIDRLHEAGQSWWAGAAAGSHRPGRLALPAPLVVCRQPAADQPRLAGRRRTVACERLRGPFVFGHGRR